LTEAYFCAKLLSIQEIFMKKRVIAAAGAALGVTTVALVGVRLRQEAEKQPTPPIGDQGYEEIQYDDRPTQIVFGGHADAEPLG
jgi:hypothetical protein